MNKRLNVVPTKSVGDIRFGISRIETRRELGKFKEFKESDGRTGDDFGNLKAYYDEAGRLQAMEIKGHDVYAGGLQVYPVLEENAKKGLAFIDDKSYANSIELHTENGKVKSVTIGTNGYLGEAPKKEKEDDDDEKTEPKKEAVDSGDLTQYYDDLKAGLDGGAPAPMMYRVAGPGGHQAAAWRQKVAHHRDCLVDGCRKRIILDIYCKVLPLDDDYKQKHMGQMRQDVDNMLTSRGLSASQYLTSASDATKAPLLEYLLRATDMIGRSYMEEADETLKNAKEKNLDLPEPEEADTEDPEIQSQLVDVTSDTEYDTFVDQLKQKTIDKIVSDVTKIIDREKEESEMEFDPKPAGGTPEPPTMEESAVAFAMNYIQGRLITEGVDMKTVDSDTVMSMAIRESTVNIMDTIFKMPDSDLRDFRSRLRLGKGSIITESLITEELLKDKAKKRTDPSDPSSDSNASTTN